MSGKAHCDLCEEVEYLEEHHIEGRKVPNSNHWSNLCNICPNCHRKIHLGVFIVERWAKSTSGMKLFWHHKGEDGTFDDAKTHII